MVPTQWNISALPDPDRLEDDAESERLVRDIACPVPPRPGKRLDCECVLKSVGIKRGNVKQPRWSVETKVNCPINDTLTIGRIGPKLREKSELKKKTI